MADCIASSLQPRIMSEAEKRVNLKFWFPCRTCSTAHHCGLLGGPTDDVHMFSGFLVFIYTVFQQFDVRIIISGVNITKKKKKKKKKKLSPELDDVCSEKSCQDVITLAWHNDYKWGEGEEIGWLCPIITGLYRLFVIHSHLKGKFGKLSPCFKSPGYCCLFTGQTVKWLQFSLLTLCMTGNRCFS